MTLMPTESRPEGSRRKRWFVLVAAALAVAVAVAAVWTLLTSKSLFPPRTLVMATGPAGGANQELGERYRAILARERLDLRLLPTAGGVENFSKLRDPHSGVSVAFVEVGIATKEESSDLVSLGTVSFEPIWLFLRDQPHTTPAQALQGKRISIGPEGSGTRVVARRLLQLNGVEETRVELLGLSPEQAAEAMLRAEIDAVVMLTSWQSPAVQRLLTTDGFVLATFPRADAYVALFPLLHKLVLPAGVVDLARNVPPADVTLLAVQESLAVRKELHPALLYLLLEAASEVHGGPGIFHKAGRFPAPEAIDLPLSDQARTFYKSGRPFLHRYLPFWLSGITERLLIVLIPLLAVAYPLTRLLPQMYQWWMQHHLFKFYGDLKRIETELGRRGAGESIDDLRSALDSLQQRANRMFVTVSFAQRRYILKNHIQLAREQLEKHRESAQSG
jgi:TRAP transporter TAXI family solute receptor